MNKKDVRYYIRRGFGKQPEGAIRAEFSYRATGIPEERYLFSLGYVEATKKEYDEFVNEIRGFKGSYDPS